MKRLRPVRIRCLSVCCPVCNLVAYAWWLGTKQLPVAITMPESQHRTVRVHVTRKLATNDKSSAADSENELAAVERYLVASCGLFLWLISIVVVGC